MKKARKGQGATEGASMEEKELINAYPGRGILVERRGRRRGLYEIFKKRGGSKSGYNQSEFVAGRKVSDPSSCLDPGRGICILWVT